MIVRQPRWRDALRERPLLPWLILVMLATMVLRALAPLTSGLWLKTLSTLWALAYYWPLQRMVVSAFMARAKHEIDRWPYGHPERSVRWRWWDRHLLMMIVVWLLLSSVPPLVIASLSAFSWVMYDSIHVVAIVLWCVGGLRIS